VATICLLPIGSEARVRELERHFQALGVDVVSANEAAGSTTPFDCLVCFVDEVGAEPDALLWLELVNRASTDVLMTTTGLRVLPAERTFWLRGDAEDWIDAVQTVTNFALSADRPEDPIPRLLVVADQVTGSERLADSWSALHDQIADSANRVAGTQRSVLAELGRGRHTSRREYDVARFVRWSQDRLDQSFVKLRMRLAGGDSHTASVSREVPSLLEVLTDSRSSDLLVLKGAPGAGKSLQLRLLETALSAQSIRRGSPADGPLPFCVALGEQASSQTNDPLEWLKARWEHRVSTQEMEPFAWHLDQGRMRLLLDGFNELPFTDAVDRREWMLSWRHLIHDGLLRSPRTVVVLACRARDLSVSLATSERPQTVVELLPLSSAEIFAIAERRNPHAADDLRAAIADDPSLSELYSTPFALSDYLAHDSSAPGVPQTQGAIFTRRICSALEREQAQNNFRLFDDRWLPLRAVISITTSDSLSDSWARLRALPLIRALGQLGHELTSVGLEGTASHAVALPFARTCSLLQGYLGLDDDASARDALDAAVDLDLLLINEGVVRFKHHSLQEFFAATGMDDDALVAAVTVHEGAFDDLLSPLQAVLAGLGPGDELPIVPITGYEQVAMRAADFRPAVVQELAAVNPWLAAEIWTAHRHPADWGDEAASRIASALAHRLDASDDVRERIACLLALGTIQDASPTSDKGGVCPDLIMIPAGTWELGIGEPLRSRLGSGRRRRRIEMPSFELGRAPVTNQEYGCFMADAGYQTRSNWSFEGWTWRTGAYPVAEVVAKWRARRDHVARQPELPLELLRQGRVVLAQAAAVRRFAAVTDAEIEAVVLGMVSQTIDAPAFWDDRRFANPRQPVVGVSWYEADAYCRWLSHKIDRHVRLPTEDEWEAAGIHVLRDDVPIGSAERAAPLSVDDVDPESEWRPLWGNTAELHLGRTSPIGAFAFPRADTEVALGVLDLFGNVFEWTADPLRPGEDARRVAKGGSWRHLIHRAVPGYRGRGDLATRNNDDGFRIVIEVV
jgi:formylglycine-generating enzyme required for sulfatase activity